MKDLPATTLNRRKTTIVFALLAIAAIAGCASHPAEKSQKLANSCLKQNNPEPNTYLDDWNRANFAIDLPLFRYVFKPVGKAYQAITPNFLQNRISNFFSNLGEVAVIANDFLQARGKAAGYTTGRFIINSTIGLFGAFDVAGKLGVHPQAIHEDFGLTLAQWGVGEGPYLVLPMLGPTTARNALSPVTDGIFFYPLTYVSDHHRALSVIYGLGFVNSARNNLDNIERITSAINPYVFTRSAYLQHRRFLVQQNSGKVESETNINCYLQQ